MGNRWGRKICWREGSLEKINPWEKPRTCLGRVGLSWVLEVGLSSVLQLEEVAEVRGASEVSLEEQTRI